MKNYIETRFQINNFKIEKDLSDSQMKGTDNVNDQKKITLGYFAIIITYLILHNNTRLNTLEKNKEATYLILLLNFSKSCQYLVNSIYHN